MLKGIITICASTISVLATAIATAISNSPGTTATNNLLTAILNAILNGGDTEMNSVCVTSPTYNGPAWQVVHFSSTGVVLSVNYYEPNGLQGAPIAGAVLDPAGTSCCGVVAPVLEPNSYDVSGGFTQPTKVSLDMPGFGNAYFAMNTAGWTAADLAAALNANAAGAVPPDTGANYSTTVWAPSAVDPNRVYVVSGPVPNTLDLVSIHMSIPVTP